MIIRIKPIDMEQDKFLVELGIMGNSPSTYKLY